MKLVIIGSGNVATILGLMAIRNEHTVLQVMSRELDNAQRLAERLHCSASDLTAMPDPDADLYLFCIADKALYAMKDFFYLKDKLVVHTAGSVPMDVLREISSNCGVLYPLQSIRKEMDPATPVPFLIDGNSHDNRETIKTFADSLSNKNAFANDAERIKIHVAAVFVCNFTNHLYSLAESFCEKEKIDFALLYPLLAETAHRIEDASPKTDENGAGSSKDMLTIERHLALLETYPKLKSIYGILTNSIIEEENK